VTGEPSLFRALVLCVLAVACLVASYYGRSLPEWAKTTLAAAGFVLLIFGGLLVWSWLQPRLADADLVRREAEATTEAVYLAREIRQMTPEQAAAFMAVYPAAPMEDDETTRIILTSADQNHSQYLTGFPVGNAQLRKVAQELVSGAPFAMTALTGKGKPLSRGQFEAMRDYCLERGLMRWVNEDAPAQGITLTPAGSDLMAHYAALPHREKA